AGHSLTLNLDGEETEIPEDFIQITITAKEGFKVEMENNLFVILDTHLTPELIKEGLAREFVSKVQQLRKTNNFEVTDHIHIIYHSDDEVKQVVQDFEAYIKEETLADLIRFVDSLEGLEEQNLN